MKKVFFFLLAALTFSACADDTIIFTPEEGGIKEPTLPEETRPLAAIDTAVFDKLNLDYPGLELVKKQVEAQDYYLAAKELLQYYRMRTNVVNPNIPSSIDLQKSAVDHNKANQALDYRFCVAKFVEDEGDVQNPADDLYYSFKTKEGTINWGFKPDVEGVDREFLYQQHRHQWMEPQARMYAATGNDEYIKSWIKVYTSWMKKYPCPNAKFDDVTIKDVEPGYEWKGLQPTERVLSQLNIIQYYLPSPDFSPEWLSTVLNAFAEHVEMIILNYYPNGNILLSQGQAVILAGMLMPEFKNASSWIESGKEVINGQFLNDGVHIDLDFGYHTAAISDLLDIDKVQKANNRTDVLSADMIVRLKKSMEFVADMTYPNYTVDNFNDTHSRTYNRTEYNRVLVNRFKDYSATFPEDENLKWMATEGAEGTRPSWTKKLYAESGYYMFRSKEWNDNKGLMMIHKNNFNSNQGWHCQPDNGTFSLWFNGINFFPDAGYFSYNDPDPTGMRDKYRRSTLHNTLSCQSKDIFETQQLGKLVYEGEGENFEVIATENVQYKEGQRITDTFTPKGNISHRRSIFFVDNKFFVIVDEGHSSSPEENTKINLNFHLYSEEGKRAEVVNNPAKNIPEYSLIKTNLSNNNLLIKTFIDNANSFETTKQKDSDEVKVSDETGKVIGDIRDFFKINARISGGLAARLITVIYPVEGAADASTAINAKFTDNDDTTDETKKGTYHEEGVKLQVEANGKTYDLEYTK